jgi:hypothetical protein
MLELVSAASGVLQQSIGPRPEKSSTYVTVHIAHRQPQPSYDEVSGRT